MMGPRLLSGHGPCWAIALTRVSFGYAELVDASGCAYGTVTKLVKEWERVGAVEAFDVADRRTQFRVIDRHAFEDAGSNPPRAPRRVESGEQNMWTAIRSLTTFTPPDVAIHAATDVTRVDEEDARAYCRALLKFSYLKVVRKAVPGQREPVYRLLRNTGPRPPRMRRVMGLEDPNTGDFTRSEDGQ